MTQQLLTGVLFTTHGCFVVMLQEQCPSEAHSFGLSEGKDMFDAPLGP